MELVPVNPLTQIRLSTGRTSAFLLFLAGLPHDKEARQRRQEWLGTDKTQAVSSLIAGAAGSMPGNRVIASPAELRELRVALRNNAITPKMADEYGIPDEALEALPDEDAFLDARNRWLLDQEQLFIESFGLELSDLE